MKTTKKFTKPLAIIAVMASLALTGCAGDKLTPENAPTPSVAGQSQSATESPSASAIELPEGEAMKPIDETAIPTADPDREMSELDKEMREGKNTALDIDPRESLDKWADDDVSKVFPESKFDVEAGIEAGLSLQHDLTTMRNFFVERDGSKDFEVLNSDLIAERIDADTMVRINNSIKEEGHFNWVPTVPSSGSIGTAPDGTELLLTGVPTSTYNVPAVSITDGGDKGDALTIRGTRTIHWEAVDGYRATQDSTYWIQVVPAGDDWNVLAFGTEREMADLTKNGETIDIGGDK